LDKRQKTLMAARQCRNWVKTSEVICLHNGVIFGFPAQNVNESVDKTRKHNLGHLRTGMGAPLPATTSVGKQPSCAIALRRPIEVLVAQRTQVSRPQNWGCVGHFASRPLQGTEKWRIESSLVDSRLPEIFCYLCYFIRSHSLSYHKR
jgi:hypothetical protein